MLSEQQREQMRVELRRAGFRDESEMRRIVDLAERYVGERSTPTSARQWRRLYEQAGDRYQRAALVVSKHVEDWLTVYLMADRRAQELRPFSEAELTLLELDEARASGNPW